jgi:hypothetical protein
MTTQANYANMEQDKTINKRKYFTVSFFILWRIFQSVVIIPATLVGSVLFVMAITGQAPDKTVIEEIYHFAEINVRPAHAGTVITYECATPENKNKPSITPTLCDKTNPIELPIPIAIEREIVFLRYLYVIFVIVSAGGLLIFRLGKF